MRKAKKVKEKVAHFYLVRDDFGYYLTRSTRLNEYCKERQFFEASVIIGDGRILYAPSGD